MATDKKSEYTEINLTDRISHDYIRLELIILSPLCNPIIFTKILDKFLLVPSNLYLYSSKLNYRFIFNLKNSTYNLTNDEFESNYMLSYLIQFSKYDKDILDTLTDLLIKNDFSDISLKYSKIKG